MFESVLDYISRTNLFNFIIFTGIIVFLYKYLNVSGSLEKAREDVAEKIEDSDLTKESSETNLSKTEDLVAHLEDDIEEIIRESEENATLVGTKVISDANKTAENIKSNSLKVIENKTEILKNDIMKKASLASIEIAKKHIYEELGKNADLHSRLIDESINAIDKIGQK